jgi:hypothetical protein
MPPHNPMAQPAQGRMLVSVGPSRQQYGFLSFATTLAIRSTAQAVLTSLLLAAGWAASLLRYRSTATRRASMNASVMRRPSIKFLSGRAGRKLQQQHTVRGASTA